MAESYAVVDNFGGRPQTKKVRCSLLVDTAAGHLGNTGIYLPTDCLVTRCYIDVITVDAAETVNVGYTGALTALADGLSVASAVQVNSAVTFPLMNLGGKEILISSKTGTWDTGVCDVFIEYIEL
jgi:hypothetical protein